MSEATPLSPELARSVSQLARSLVAAARTWSLYPREHPAVQTAVERLRRTLAESSNGAGFSFGVTPETLLVDGIPMAVAKETAIGEAAAWLHQRDVLELSFLGDVPAPTLEALLALLAEDIREVRARGGPAKVWVESGPHLSVAVTQIDYTGVLEAPETEHPVRKKDDLWRSIVRAVSERRKTLDEAIQRRMLEIAGDIPAIGSLAEDVMAPNRAADGSPMLTSQAAAVVAAYHHLVTIVEVMAPERRSEVMQNLAEATATLDPRVIMHMLSGAETDATGAGPIRKGLADAFDDFKVAQLLATTLAIDGQASDRLANVFDTIAPDEERKRRVLTLTRSLLSESAFGKTDQFRTLWASTEELLLTYNEKPFVSAEYRAGLDQAGARADAMAGGETPPEFLPLIETLGQENVRKLSIVLLVDLLRLERDPARGPELARDVAALCEDLLLAGDYPGAAAVTEALAEHAATPSSVVSAGCRVALDGLVNTAAFHEATDMLGDMGETEVAQFSKVCQHVGPAATEALRDLLAVEAMTLARRRATAIIRGYGGRAVTRLTALVGSPHWYAQRNAADLLGEIASPEAVPLLQPLLRGSDPRVMRAAVGALANIDDPAAARSVHTVLRAAAGAQRDAVVAALVAERDPRVVPVLARILEESDPLGTDHALVLQTLGAVRQLGGDRAIPAVVGVMKRRRLFARGKTRAIKQTAVDTLRAIDTPASRAALADAAAHGDRLLRRLARAHG